MYCPNCVPATAHRKSSDFVLAVVFPLERSSPCKSSGLEEMLPTAYGRGERPEPSTSDARESKQGGLDDACYGCSPSFRLLGVQQ
jgi:hypothetical protein